MTVKEFKEMLNTFDEENELQFKFKSRLIEWRSLMQFENEKAINCIFFEKEIRGLVE